MSMYSWSGAFFLKQYSVPCLCQRSWFGKAVILSLHCWSTLKLQELRRLFETSTLQWDAENFGRQSLMEVALERQTLGISWHRTELEAMARCLDSKKTTKKTAWFPSRDVQSPEAMPFPSIWICGLGERMRICIVVSKCFASKVLSNSSSYVQFLSHSYVKIQYMYVSL